MKKSKPQSLKNVGGLKQFDLPPQHTGIYFLCLEDEVVYVGQSTNFLRRIAQHISEGEKQFDQVFIRNCNPDELDLLESTFIHDFEPKHNLTMSNGKKLAPMSLQNMNELGFVLRDKEKPVQPQKPLSVASTNERPDSAGNFLMKLPQVVHKTQLGKSSIYQGVKEGTFPAPIKLARRAVRWPAASIDAWITERIAAGGTA